MNDTKTPNGRIDRRLILAALAAIGLTVVGVLAVSGINLGSSTPTSSAAATLPPVVKVDQVVADGRAVPTRTAELAVDAPATIESVRVELGQTVIAGAMLVTMDGEAIDAELAGATAGVEGATARAAQADAAVTQALEGVKVAEANQAQAQAALETARDRNIGEDEAVAARDAARAQVRVAKAALVGTQEAARAAAADVRRAEAAVTSLEIRRAGLTLSAPFAGTVASLAAAVGQRVNPGQVVVRIADTSAWEFVTTDLDESAIARIAVGDAASVTLDGVPGVEIPATVARIGTFGESRQGGIVYEVVVTPDGAVPDGTRWNMTATIAIETAE